MSYDFHTGRYFGGSMSMAEREAKAVVTLKRAAEAHAQRKLAEKRMLGRHRWHKWDAKNPGLAVQREFERRARLRAEALASATTEAERARALRCIRHAEISARSEFKNQYV